MSLYVLETVGPTYLWGLQVWQKSVNKITDVFLGALQS